MDGHCTLFEAAEAAEDPSRLSWSLDACLQISSTWHDVSRSADGCYSCGLHDGKGCLVRRRFDLLKTLENLARYPYIIVILAVGEHETGKAPVNGSSNPAISWQGLSPELTTEDYVEHILSCPVLIELLPVMLQRYGEQVRKRSEMWKADPTRKLAISSLGSKNLGAISSLNEHYIHHLTWDC